jgi:hypothetical protein
VEFPVLVFSEKFQVRQSVVTPVVISVMNLVARRNRTVRGDPDDEVQQVAGGVVIVPNAGVPVVTVPVELEPGWRSRGGVREHPTSVSPGLIDLASAHSSSPRAMR